MEVTLHTSREMYEPLVRNLLQHHGQGTSCILTQTNEEAIILVALLRKKGINGKLIQSLEGFRFWNLAEVRAFIKYIDRKVSTPLIPDDLWEEAKQVVFEKYNESLCLAYLKRCVELFEQTNRTKYVSDFKEFVFESSVEDFCDLSDAEVVVSTIHKAKGREFDDVYMMVSGNYRCDDDLLRRYYVGMTRAKKRLFVHTNANVFSRLYADKYIVDQQDYSIPEEIVLQLSHKDVYLDFFRNRKKEVLALRGGDMLTFKDNVLYDANTGKAMAKLSKNMQDTLTEWFDRGYQVKTASVRFVVAWKPKEAPSWEPETAVLLADLVLSRSMEMT